MKPLLAGLTWDWRVAPSPDALFTPWAAEIPPHVREWTGVRQRVPGPTCWHVCLAPLPATEESQLSRDNLPASDAPEHALAPDADGLIDLHATLLPAGARCRANRVAVLSAEWTPPADAENLLLLISADWHARLWLDDALVWDTWASGNRIALDARAHAVPVSSLPGNPPRRLRLWVAAGSGGWATRLIATRLVAAPQSEPPPAPVVEARRCFAAPPTSPGSHLAFLGPEPARVFLNGRSLPAHPTDGLQRERLDDLPIDLLLPDENELRLRWEGAEALAGLRHLTSGLDPFLTLADSPVRAFVLAADLALEDDNDPPAWPPVLVAQAGGLVRVVHTHATRRPPGGPADAPPARWHRSPAGPLTLRDPARARLVFLVIPRRNLRCGPRSRRVSPPNAPTCRCVLAIAFRMVGSFTAGGRSFFNPAHHFGCPHRRAPCRATTTRLRPFSMPCLPIPPAAVATGVLPADRRVCLGWTVRPIGRREGAVGSGWRPNSPPPASPLFSYFRITRPFRAVTTDASTRPASPARPLVAKPPWSYCPSSPGTV